MSYYRINNTDLTLQPSTGRWIPREILGIDGNGHPIYPTVHEFELDWDLIAVDELYQLQNFFDTLGTTGTISIDLPKYKTQTYEFTTYSGCVMHDMEYGEYFEEHPASAKLLITGIRVS